MINIETLKNYSQVKKYPSGTIFSRNGIGTEMYIVLQGEVALLNSQDNKIVSLIGPGDFFNEELLFSDKVLPITALAVTDVIALPISKYNISSFIANEPNFIVELMKAMYERMEKICNDFEGVAGYKWVVRKPEIKADEPIKKAEETNNQHNAASNNKIEESDAKSEKDAQAIVTNKDFKLFPEGHTGNYELQLTKANNIHMCEIDYCCPVCRSKFKGLKILTSRLALTTTDNDLRKHHKDIEPVYYEVITCPNCMFSALSSLFETAEDVKESFVKELKSVKSTVNFKFGTTPDTASIFAGYYLALLCAPKCFPKSQFIEAKLLHRLSWMYHDCKDEQMELKTAKLALDKYMEAYSVLFMSADQEIQTCMIIGELNFKLGNITEAKNYYYKAKMNKQMTVVLRRRAENRLEELKEIEQGKK